MLASIRFPALLSGFIGRVKRLRLALYYYYIRKSAIFQAFKHEATEDVIDLEFSEKS
jgi:hypothetical protein